MATPQSGPAPYDEPGDYLCLTVQGEEYGIRTTSVRQVLAVPPVRRVPKTPPFVRGVANIMGRIVPVLDMVKRFGFEDSAASGQEEVVYVQEGNAFYGLLVESIRPMVHLGSEDIEPVNPLMAPVDAPFLRAMARVDERLIHLLDLTAFVHAGISADQERKKVFDVFSTRMLEKERRVEVGSRGRRTLLFAAGEDEYGLDLGCLQSVLPATSLKTMQGGPGFLAGIVEAGRSQLPVVDLLRKSGLAPLSGDEDAMVVVLTTGRARYGLLASRIHGVADIDEGLIRESPVVLKGDDGRHISGVAMLKEGRQLVMMLDETRILDERDLKALKELKSVSITPARARRVKKEKDRSFVIFSVAGKVFALPVEDLASVIEFTKPQRVPRSPDFVRGILQVEGELVSVIDLRKRFGLEAEVEGQEEWIIVLNADGARQGFLADSVTEILRVAPDAISPAPEKAMGVDSGFIKGVIAGAKGVEQVPIILDAGRVVSG